MASGDRSAASQTPPEPAAPYTRRLDAGGPARGRYEPERTASADLPRLPEAFHRVYSPPEGPRARTRRRTFGAGAVVAVLGVLALAATGLLAFGRGAAVRHQAAVPRPSMAASHAASPSALASVPGACDVLPAATVRRFVPVPKPHTDRMGVDTASVCTYSATQGRVYRAVQVDVRAFLPRYLHAQTASMTAWSYGAQWTQAQKDLNSDTSSLRRIGGLGDAAFERYWIDRDVHAAVGEVTVRYLNVVLRTRYSEEQPSAAARAQSERRCLAQAIAAARAGLLAFH